MKKKEKKKSLPRSTAEKRYMPITIVEWVKKNNKKQPYCVM